MQFKIPRQVFVASTLALLLGMAAPTMAFAEEAASDTTGEDQATAVILADEEEVSSDEEVVVAAEGDSVDGQAADDQGTEAQEADDQEASAEGNVEDNNVQATETEDEAETVVDGSDDVTVEVTEEVTEEVDEVEAEDVTSTEELEEASDEEAEPSVVGNADDGSMTVPEGTYVFGMKDKNTAVLDVYANSNTSGANVHIYTDNGSDAQKWDVHYVASGLYTIFKHGSKTLALTIANDKNASGTNVVVATNKGDKGQLWMFKDLGSGYYNIVSWLNPSLVLDVYGGKTANKSNVQVYTDNGTNAQKFRLYDANQADPSDVTLEDGTYSVKCASSTSYSLDIYGSSKANGANVQLYKSNNTQAQKFYFKSDGKGYYTISVIGSGKVLSTKNASALPGNNVQQSNYTGADTQKWALRQNGSNYELVNKATGLVLDIYGGKFNNKQNVQCYTSNGTAAQKFTITRTHALTDGIYTINSYTDTSKVLDIKGGSASNGTGVWLYSSNNTLAQRFEVQLVGTGNEELYRIRTAASGGFLTYNNPEDRLADTDNDLIQYGKHSTSQNSTNTWELVWNGTYFSMLNLDANKVLDLKGGSTANKTIAQVYTANTTDAQHFYFTPANLIQNGTYVIQSAVYKSGEGYRALDTYNNNARSVTKSGSCDQRFVLTATNSVSNIYTIVNAYDNRTLTATGTANTTNVNTAASNTGADSQKWEARISDGGYLMFVNVNSKKALAVQGNNEASGTNVQQYQVSYSRAQKWKPYRVEWEITNGNYYFYDANGNKTTGWNSNTYTTWTKIKKMTSGTKYLGSIYVTNAWAHFFIRDGNNCWRPYKTFRVTVGNESAGTPTPTGIYHTSGKKGYMGYGTDESSFYYWTIWNPTEASGWGNGFHSVSYYTDTFRVRNGRLGAHISGGSVRCALENAKWIYDNIMKGTTVYSYR